MMRTANRVAWLVTVIGVCASGACFGQSVPFVAPGATAFDPEISVVNSGVLNDVQGVVSQDRKYVTINAQASNSQLLALQTFAFQRTGGMGVVGSTVAATTTGTSTSGNASGAGANASGAGGAGGARASGSGRGAKSGNAQDSGRVSAAPVFAAGSILARTGMTRISMVP